MRGKIQKWGNSLGLRISKAFAEEVGVRAGADVDISLEEGRLVVSAVRSPSYKLEDLLSRVRKDNVHEGIETGDAVGREAW
ncbi:MAG: AbrB/MazE/SpoVT family DNA-binding domain-containing protein [Planctomycetes bacterium]|nr:AbrB/MazE/SpoVT family DNA-binding domain-containing protein [Planctomycetota bacterium]